MGSAFLIRADVDAQAVRGRESDRGVDVDARTGQPRLDQRVGVHSAAVIVSLTALSSQLRAAPSPT